MTTRNDVFITIAEMVTFSVDADNAFKYSARDALIDHLAMHPEAGEGIPGTSGIRRLRWPLKAAQSTGRYQVIYWFHDLTMPVYLLALYAPGERVAFDINRRAALAAQVQQLIAEHERRRSLRGPHTEAKGG